VVKAKEGFMLKQNVNVLESVILVQGTVLLNDGRRRIDLKRPIRDILYPLETEKSKVAYNMELCLSKKKLTERTEELLDQEIVPILLYFTKEELKEAGQ
jgi:hypothetical protein